MQTLKPGRPSTGMTERVFIPMTAEEKQQLSQLAKADQRSMSGMGAIIYRLGLATYRGSLAAESVA